MFVRVFLAASRLQVRSLDVFVLHTSHRGAAARAVGMIDENEHPIESSRVDLVGLVHIMSTYLCTRGTLGQPSGREETGLVPRSGSKMQRRRHG